MRTLRRPALLLLLGVVSIATACASDAAPRDAGREQAPDLPEPVANPAAADSRATPDPASASAPTEYAPAPGTRLRYLGWLVDDHGHLHHLDVLDRVSEGAEGGRELRRTSRVGERLGEWGEAVSEGYLLVRRERAVLVGLLPDPYRDVPPPATVLRLPPEVGASWTVDESDDRVRAEITAVESATTLAGTVDEAVRVELRPASGAWRESRWYGPGRGLVRVVRTDAGGRRILGLALARDELPTEAHLFDVLPR